MPAPIKTGRDLVSESIKLRRLRDSLAKDSRFSDSQKKELREHLDAVIKVLLET